MAWRTVAPLKTGRLKQTPVHANLYFRLRLRFYARPLMSLAAISATDGRL